MRANQVKEPGYRNQKRSWMNLEQFHGSSGTVQKEERERKSPARLVKELARDPSRLALGLRVRDP